MGTKLDVYTDLPGELADHLSAVTGILITADDMTRSFYFYVFNDQWVLAISGVKGEKYLRVDGVWHTAERLKY